MLDDEPWMERGIAVDGAAAFVIYCVIIVGTKVNGWLCAG